MEDFYNPPDHFIPEIRFYASTGELSISGESFHEYSVEFYQPVFRWLREFFAIPNQKVTMSFRMTYFNTNTSRRFLEIFDMLEEYERKNSGLVTVNWYYKAHDIDMKESGEEYIADTNIVINLIPYVA